MPLHSREPRPDGGWIRQSRSRLRRGIAAGWWVALLAGSGVLADLPQSRLLTVFPAGASAGSTNEITVAGTDLEDSTGLLFSDPRIRGELLPDRPSTFQVIVPAGVPEGMVDVRWAGRFGVSNPRAFAIGSGSEWILNPTNTAAPSALVLPADTVLNGRMPSSQTLWFRLQLPEGRRWMAQVLAAGLDSRFEPGLRLFDAHGSEFDHARRGVLEITGTAGGTRLLQLRDLTYRGGDEFVFRMKVSGGPWLDFAIPNVLREGTTNHVTLFGRNLEGGKPSPWTAPDGRPLEQLTVDILAPFRGDPVRTPVELLGRPASAVLAGECLEWRWTHGGESSNPLLFALTDLAVSMAGWTGEPPPEALAPVTVPTEFCGRFPARGGISGVTFEAKKGEVYWMELWTERIGFPGDAFALVQRERGTRGEKGEVLYADVLELGDNETNPGGTDFNTVTRDPVGRFEAPQDGRYRVLVRDLFHPGADSPRLPYRLSIRRESPGFALVALPLQPIRANDTDRAVHALAPFVRRDGTELIRVVAFRRDGFNGDIELRADGLTGGLTAAVSRIPTGQSVGYLPVTAATNSAGVQHPVIRGRAMIGTNAVERIASMAVSGPTTDFNDQTVAARLVREPLMSVSEVEWAPVTLEPSVTTPLEVTPDGKVAVPVAVVRRGEFTGAFNLRLAGRTELEKSKEASVPEKATNAVLEFVMGEAKLPEGLHRVWLQGQVAGKYRNNPEALALAEADLKAADAALASASDADKSKLEERKKTAAERLKSAEERAKPRDVTFRIYSPPFELKVIPAPKPEAKP